ncbi:hypothetical protein EJ06DRAFT_554504 [Trichodelitschia bisporula]|uniref:Regulatory P domain-containing protein n=1 Tax=Trichodelitschia bisporula TaxID=703511 RepID=A0A6G1I3S5_9PEZI|nr:hypothetical protein EJ06DRAFT_554504 [Trichodelitschia bisporula]
MVLLRILGAAALASFVLGKEMAVNEAKAAMYESGQVMEEIMALKFKTWQRQEQLGRLNSKKYKEISSVVPCVNGLAVASPGDAMVTFKCKNMDLYNFKSHADLGSKTGQGSSSWGWTSPEGREFVAIGQADGTAFVEINKEGKMLYLGRLAQYPDAKPAVWREIRGFKDYVAIGSEAEKHGIQIFDMKKLLKVDPASPVIFDNLKDLTGHYKDLPVGRTHNVVSNPESNFIYSVGAVPRNDTCRSGIIAINMTDVANPTFSGCASADGYVHDAQCLIYRGPDSRYLGHEICYGYNENKMTIYDFTEKTAPVIVSRTSYEGASYTHQGWVLDPNNQEWLLMDDEYDEVNGEGPAEDGYAVTYIWNISNLQQPKQTGYFRSTAHSIDHNMYVHEGFAYQSNYGAGLRILDVRSIPSDPTGGGVTEVGFFDIYPEDDKAEGGGVTEFVGTWSSYSYFKSGYIFVNSIERGAWVLKPTVPLI